MAGLTRIVLAMGVVLAGSALFGFAAVNAGERESSAGDPDAPTPIYERRDDCAPACFSSATSDRFLVARELREIEFVVYANLDATSGPAQVTLTDPSGDVRYERLFTPQKTGRATQDSARWPALAGEWTLTRSYVGTTGSLSFDAWGLAAPLG